MAVSAANPMNSLERYIEEIRSIWGDGKDPRLPFKVKALMEKMLATTSPDEPWMAELIREGKPSRELYRDPNHGFVQMGHVHPRVMATLPTTMDPAGLFTARMGD